MFPDRGENDRPGGALNLLSFRSEPQRMRDLLGFLLVARDREVLAAIANHNFLLVTVPMEMNADRLPNIVFHANLQMPEHLRLNAVVFKCS